MSLRWMAALLLIGISVLSAQKYTGPRPPKPDVPYLVLADNLVETDAAEAKEEQRKDGTAYTLEGVSARARTPLAEPIFIVEAKTLSPDRLGLYRLEVRNGRREIVISQKKRSGARPLRLTVTRLGNGLFRLEANEHLDNGQYSLSPEGSNQVFSFEVY